MRDDMRLGFFGGSFSPVHKGHFDLVRYLHSYSLVDRVIIMPTFQNPLKAQKPVENDLRIKMLRETFRGFERTWISLYEIEKEVTETLTTVKHFPLIQGQELVIIFGVDVINTIDQWEGGEELLSLANFLVFGRNGEELKIKAPNVQMIDCKLPDISSTEIRKSPIETIRENNWMHPEALKLWEQYITDQENHEKANHTQFA